MVRKPFEQRWNLFAPDPPSANLSTHLWMDTGDRTIGPIDLSKAVKDDARSHRFNASKLVRVVTKLNVALEEDPRREVVEWYRRMLSGAAWAFDGVISVRGVLVATPVRSFDDRHRQPREPTVLYDSGWMPFASDVEPMELDL